MTGPTRRTVLMGAAAALALPSAGRAQPGRAGRIRIGVIGAGGMGASNAERLTGEAIVAAADPDWSHVARAFAGDAATRPTRAALKQAYDGAERHTDYRRLFDRHHRELDAVLIATPDHHHAPAAKMALDRGLHVYLQKPLTHGVREGRMLADLAAANPRLVTQMGNQGHSGDDGRRVIELIRGGAIGTVREVHAWTNRPVWPQGRARPEARPTPADFDWQSWIGPATVDWGYHPDYAHFNWRGWAPFGTGALGDMGAHLLDFPVWALELGLPNRVETRASPWGGDDNLWDNRPPAELAGLPLASITYFSFDKAPGGPIPLTWYDGGLMPQTPAGLPEGAVMDPEGGVLYVGTRGRLMHGTYGETPVIWGDGAAERAAAIPQSLPRIPGSLGGHEANWLAAIRDQAEPSCPFRVAAPLNEAMLLGIVAMQAGQAIDYNAAAGRITNLPEADALLDRTWRNGWG